MLKAFWDWLASSPSDRKEASRAIRRRHRLERRSRTRQTVIALIGLLVAIVGIIVPILVSRDDRDLAGSDEVQRPSASGATSAPSEGSDSPFPPDSITASSTPQLSASPTSEPRTVTEIRVYEPYALDGALKAPLWVRSRPSGTCTIGGSLTGRSDTARCFTDEFVLDPCFLNPYTRRQIVCPGDPWTEAILSIDIPADDWVSLIHGGPPDDGSLVDTPPWAVELASGEYCLFIQGAGQIRIGGKRVDYGCATPELFGSVDLDALGIGIVEIDRSHEPWQALIVTPEGVALVVVDIAVSWH